MQDSSTLNKFSSTTSSTQLETVENKFVCRTNLCSCWIQTKIWDGFTLRSWMSTAFGQVVDEHVGVELSFFTDL